MTEPGYYLELPDESTETLLVRHAAEASFVAPRYNPEPSTVPLGNEWTDLGLIDGDTFDNS